MLPEGVAGLRLPGVAAVWLTAGPAVLDARIRASSRWETRTSEERSLIERFAERTRGFDAALRAAVTRLGLPLVDTAETSPATLVEDCLDRMRPAGTDGGGAPGPD